MKNTMENNDNLTPEFNTDRRSFLGNGVKIALLSGIAGVGLLAACNNEEKKSEEKKDDTGKDEDKDKKAGEEKEVSPPEDLMQEHGLLNRILLIYDTCRVQLVDNKKVQLDALSDAAGIIRTFVEDYHEKQEENYLFPRFKKANQLTDLVDTLLQQHNAGRAITDQIMQLTKSKTLNEAESQKLLALLTQFNVMYRPHEAREDTVLFPAFRKIVSQNEYDSLGEEFEDNEHKLFGEDGFEKMVDKVSDIEKKLGIYELSQFTPTT